MLVFVSFFEILYLLIFFLIYMYCTREINLMSRHKVYWSIPDKKFPLGGWKVAKLGDSPT